MSETELLKLLLNKLQEKFRNPLDFITLWLVHRKLCVHWLNQFIECEPDYLGYLVDKLVCSLVITQKQVNIYYTDLANEALAKFGKN